MGTPAWAHCRPETRVGGSPAFSSIFASQETANPVGTPIENKGCGYDFASGVHKYLYANANPINIDDPSGHDGDVISLDVSMNLAAGIGAFSLAAVYEAKTHAIGTLAVAAFNEASTEGASIAATAESILSVYRTSVRDLIKQAEDSLKQTGRALRKIKVVPMPRSIIPDVAANVTAAQAAGQPAVLERVPEAVRKANYRAAVVPLGSAGPGKSWDEYPFASGRLPGSPPPRVVAVPALQNSIQGGIISGCFKIEGINVGTPFIVIVTP